MGAGSVLEGRRSELMIDVELWRAKVDVIAAFASGPGIMIEDNDERDDRIASMLGIIDLEWEGTSLPRSATISPIRGGEIHASNTQINWPKLVERMRAEPGVPVKLLYDRMHTAVVTATRTRRNYPDVTTMTERRGDAGLLILTID